MPAPQASGPWAGRQSSSKVSENADGDTVLSRFAFCNALLAPRHRISGILAVAPGRADTVAMPILTVSRP